MPSSRNSRPVQKKSLPAKKQWKVARSKRSATLGKTKSKTKAEPKWAIGQLQKNYPDAHCALNFETPYQLLIATILSAQCTDVRVNLVTPGLFREYPDPKSMSKASQEKVEKLIQSAGFYRNKAKNIIACSQMLMDKHGGEVPRDLDALVELAGVGRKTGNVVLGNAFNITSGVVVDTHVTRLSGRLGWTRSENAVVIERDLSELIPREHWIMISHWLIEHGRQICSARKPRCQECFLFDRCPRVGVQ